MKKKTRLYALLILVAALLVSGLSAAAADTGITYLDNAEHFIFDVDATHSPTDLFGSFKGVMPGDTLNQKIVIKNDAVKKHIVVYMRCAGVEDGSEELFKQLGLCVTPVGGTKAYESPEQQAVTLTDWVELGTVQAGGKVTLSVDLTVPITMGNEFQDAVGKVNWEFKVNEFDDPQTGDSNDALLWGAAAVICAAGTVLLVRKKRLFA